MAKYIYKPTGAEVTAPDGLPMPAELFEPVSAKPKTRKAKTGEAKKAEPKEA